MVAPLYSDALPKVRECSPRLSPVCLAEVVEIDGKAISICHGAHLYFMSIGVDLLMSQFGDLHAGLLP